MIELVRLELTRARRLAQDLPSPRPGTSAMASHRDEDVLDDQPVVLLTAGRRTACDAGSAEATAGAGGVC